MALAHNVILVTVEQNSRSPLASYLSSIVLLFHTWSPITTVCTQVHDGVIDEIDGCHRAHSDRLVVSRRKYWLPIALVSSILFFQRETRRSAIAVNSIGYLVWTKTVWPCCQAPLPTLSFETVVSFLFQDMAELPDGVKVEIDLKVQLQRN